VHDGETGDSREVADVTGGDSETELQGGGGNEQSSKAAYAPGSLVAPDASGESGRLDGDRMHRHVADEFIDEGLSFRYRGAGNPACSRLSAGWTRWKAGPQPG
jgi:hypothetical protein